MERYTLGKQLAKLLGFSDTHTMIVARPSVHSRDAPLYRASESACQMMKKSIVAISLMVVKECTCISSP